MFKKMTMAAPLAIVLLSSSAVFAVEPINQTINVRAFIPTATFNVAPIEDGFGDDVEMKLVNPNNATDGFRVVNATYVLKHTDPKGAINAFIEGGQAAATLYNGTNGIPLTVSMAGVPLTEASKEVVNETESVPGVQRQLTIRAAAPTAAQTGDYKGSFTVVHEPVLKP